MKLLIMLIRRMEIQLNMKASNVLELFLHRRGIVWWKIGVMRLKGLG
jgi:hypothetical protein